MEYKFFFSSLFNTDLEKIISYYHGVNIPTSKKYYYGIMEQIKRLNRFPQLGRIVPECEDLFYDKYRELIFENYRIIYRTESNKIFVLRILDSRMNIDFNQLE